MATIPTNYPGGSTDEQIQQAIKELSEDIVKSSANINTVLQVAPLVQLGQNELQKRIVEKSSKTADKAERIAIGIASFSIILSLVAIGFSYVSFKSDENWQKEEARLLGEIEKEIKNEQDANKTTNEILNEIKADLEKLKEFAAKVKVQ